MSQPCPGCGCTRRHAASEAAHAVIAALANDDLDLAIESGLLAATHCDACMPDCSAQLRAARDQRVAALAARERFRARNTRLQQRTAERALQRGAARSAARPDVAAPGQAAVADPSLPARPALPAAAAAALVRAKAKAAQRGRQ